MTMSAPHGGMLHIRLANETERARLMTEAATLPRITVRDARVISDVELLGVGAISPLEGFMGRADYDSVIERMRLADGLPWSLPVTLAVSSADAATLRPKTRVTLRDEAGNILAVMDIAETFA